MATTHYTSPRPLTILQVFNRYLQPGGEENSVARMAEDWAKAGHRVIRFWRSTAEWQRPGGPSRLRQGLWLWWNPGVLRELEQTHRAVAPDLWVLHNPIPVISLGVYRLARRLGARVIQALHNCRPVSVSGTLFDGRAALSPSDPWRNLKEVMAGAWNGRLATAWLALAYAAARARGDFQVVHTALAVSDATAAVFRQAGWFADRLVTLRHCWTPRPRPKAVENDGTFLFLGRVVGSKGAEFLLRLWREPALSGVPLVIAGDGPLADALRAQSPPGVRWVGYVAGDAKDALVQRCRAIVFPCLAHEALTTGIYEAYECLKPVLVSDIGGSREIVVDQRTGRLLPAGDANAWRHAVLGLDGGSARQMGEAGRTWLEDNASAAEWNRRFDAVAARVLEPGQRERGRG